MQQRIQLPRKCWIREIRRDYPFAGEIDAPKNAFVIFYVQTCNVYKKLILGIIVLNHDHSDNVEVVYIVKNITIFMKGWKWYLIFDNCKILALSEACKTYYHSYLFKTNNMIFAIKCNAVILIWQWCKLKQQNLSLSSC